MYEYTRHHKCRLVGHGKTHRLLFIYVIRVGGTPSYSHSSECRAYHHHHQSVYFIRKMSRLCGSTASKYAEYTAEYRMTGLDPNNDRLLEIACIVTDGQLCPVDEGVSYVIRTQPHVLQDMDEWCVRDLKWPSHDQTQTTTHTNTGLIDACLDAKMSHVHQDVRAAVLAYVLDRIPEARIACLAGSSVHADKAFLVNEMPELIKHLHYRIVDVSTIKELVRRWYGTKYEPARRNEGTAHRCVKTTVVTHTQGSR